MQGKNCAESEAKIGLEWGAWIFAFVFPILWILLQKKPLLIFFCKNGSYKKQWKVIFLSFLFMLSQKYYCTMITNQSSIFYRVFIIIFCFFENYYIYKIHNTLSCCKSRVYDEGKLFNNSCRFSFSLFSLYIKFWPNGVHP